MAHIRDFRDLIVWQRSVDFIVEVYQLTRRFPVDERYGITSQLRRAAVSVSSNIAEGSGRTSLPDRRNFLGFSRGSMKESESLLLVSQRLGFVSVQLTSQVRIEAQRQISLSQPQRSTQRSDCPLR